MGAYYSSITEEQAELIRASRLFFVASADPGLGSVLRRVQTSPSP